MSVFWDCIDCYSDQLEPAYSQPSETEMLEYLW